MKLKDIVKEGTAILKNMNKHPFRVLAAAITMAGVYTGVKEGYQEIFTENTIINVGPIIIHNKEDRQPIEVINDIEEALLNMEGIEKMYAGEDLTVAEKEEFLNKVIKTIADEANINTDSISNFNLLKNSGGSYKFLRVAGLTVSYNRVFVKEEIIENNNLIILTELIIHEMLHAVESENFYVSGQLTDFEKELYTHSALTNEGTYYSTFAETSVYMNTTNIMMKLQESYNSNQTIGNIRYSNMHSIFDEYVINLYDLEFTPAMHTADFREALVITPEYIRDADNYLIMTTEELFLAGYKKTLQDQGIDYTGIDLKETYLYEVFVNSLSEEIRGVRYIDFSNNNYKVGATNIENIENFLSMYNAETDSESTLGYSVALLANSLRYNSSNYTKEEQATLLEIVNTYVVELSEEYIVKYGLKDVKAAAYETLSEDDSNVDMLDNERDY